MGEVRPAIGHRLADHGSHDAFLEPSIRRRRGPDGFQIVGQGGEGDGRWILAWRRCRIVFGDLWLDVGDAGERCVPARLQLGRHQAVDHACSTPRWSETRNTKAAKRFLGKALRGLKEWQQPEVLNTDKAPAYAAAIAELKAEGKCPTETRHRQVKYLNNVIEADHGKLKLLIRPVRGFKTLKTAYATMRGFEVMRALRKGQAGMFALQGGIVGEARIVERAFDLEPCALTEAMALLQDRLANTET